MEIRYEVLVWLAYLPLQKYLYSLIPLNSALDSANDIRCLIWLLMYAAIHSCLCKLLDRDVFFRRLLLQICFVSS